ncbi:hypothetical protein DFH09DRAFT_1411036 [Mycena vulgaris]|nr:hypothetical protein DFH09DRAFT_1411036 [Mycena vulgaris]
MHFFCPAGAGSYPLNGPVGYPKQDFEPARDVPYNTCGTSQGKMAQLTTLKNLALWGSGGGSLRWPRAGSPPPNPQCEGTKGSSLPAERNRKMVSVRAQAAFNIVNAQPPPLDSPSSIAAARPHAARRRRATTRSLRSNLNIYAPGCIRASSRVSSLRHPHCPSASDRGKVPVSARAWFFENESTSDSSVDAENAGGTECGRRRQPHPPARPLAPPARNSVLRTYGVSRDRDVGRGGAAHGHDKAPRSRAALIAWRATTRDGPASIISVCCTSSMICETPRDGGASDKVNKPYEYQAEMGKDDRGVLLRGAGEAIYSMRPSPTAAGESEAAFYILDRIKVNRGIPNPKSIGGKLLRRERANVASSAD